MKKGLSWVKQGNLVRRGLKQSKGKMIVAWIE